MSFKLRYTTEELLEHLRGRMSYWQGQKEQSERLLKHVDKQQANWLRSSLEKKRNETQAEREERIRYGSTGDVMLSCAFITEMNKRMQEIRHANERMRAITLIQCHIPDLHYHDLEFTDLARLEIEA